jgi:hypothetical protein
VELTFLPVIHKPSLIPNIYLCRSDDVSAAIEHLLNVERQLNELLKSKSAEIKEAEQVAMKNKAKEGAT